MKGSTIDSNVFVTEKDIQYTVSMWTGDPVEKVSLEESDKLLNLEKTLHKRIIGRHETVEAVRDPKHPVASFLFTDPTGVGKTELANALAIEYFGNKEAMIRLDMSEFMEKHTVSKLIRSPPGYIGYENGGQLTEVI
ncbi:ATP-dependent Clp protease ATP-binding subunit ClpA-like, chloroplastic [Quillaja saponaria]|uniref:ATP-dependent Clp protease ATP-binding subunit ClpA-like, chloroplastic n=1 Tax=Quillaja saponaria TaxID=32244 RepID=A0AAD7PZ06_QUISA|nr:ATP-dependent Clp protease ATP-binding subunit ClpA-like, chloroplastic [Quillaja saponaria]